MGKTEEDIKIESDTFALKREYKYALENLNGIKKDTAEIISVKDKVTSELHTAEEELTRVKNDISQEKLDWASFRHSELQEIEQKKSEADNVIKRKGELNEQEETIRQIEQRNIDTLNETRRLELKVQDDKNLLEVKERELEKKIEEYELKESKLQKDKMDFKNKVVNVLKEVELL